MSDQVLIQKILDGNDHAFRLLVEKYRNELFKVTFAVLRDRNAAEDAAQEVFLKIYHSLPQYEDQGFKTWMKRIAVNHAIDMKRKKERQREDIMDVIDFDRRESSHGNIETKFMRKETVELVRQRIHQLPEGYRHVIYDFYINEKTYQQMADEQNVQVKTIETKLYRARQWMKKHWKEDDFS
ncbi:sigma-70 family RNA polymerase sigma factor [Cytobacillus sp. FSL R7-0696]|uniref:RNA polymerase sigma factor n=1 Tax=Cytobacillus sp. FSL R7-0696 TaxID=2921691 RepID=UPI0030FC1E4B